MENPWSEEDDNDLDAELNKYHNIISQNLNNRFTNPVNIPSPPRYDPNEFENDYSSTLSELMSDKDLTSLDKIKTIIALYTQFVPQDVSDALTSLIDSVETENIYSQPIISHQIQPQIQQVNIKKILIKSSLNTINILPTKPLIQQQTIITEINKVNKAIQTENNSNNSNEYENKSNSNHSDNEYIELQKTLRITREVLENQDKTIKHLYKVLNINKETEDKKLEIMKKRNNKYNNNNHDNKSMNLDDVIEEEDVDNNDNNDNNNKPPLYPNNDYGYIDEENGIYDEDNEYIDEG